MEIKKTQLGDIVNLSVSGRLDTATAPALQEEIISAFEYAAEIEIDMSDLVYVSSAGLRVFLLSEKTAKAQKKALRLSHVSTDVKAIFDMTGFSEILTII